MSNNSSNNSNNSNQSSPSTTTSSAPAAVGGAPAPTAPLSELAVQATGPQMEPLGDFADTLPGTGVGIASEPLPLTYARNPDASLSSWLQRPVCIYTGAWSSSAFSTVMLRPWDLWLADAQTAHKVGGFALLRGTLKVRAMFNGTPLQYGALVMSYAPGVAPAGTKSGVPDTWTVMRASQLRHVWITGSGSSVGEITCPFISQRPYADITSSGAGTDFYNLGRLQIQQYTGLSSCNNETVIAGTLRIFAWLEDADLCVPTYKSSAPPTEKGAPGGLVSGMAHKVSKVANMVKSVPVVGAYAGVVEDVANVVGSVASFFGFSRPFNAVEPSVMLNKSIGPMAVTDGVDSIMRLSASAKNSTDQGRGLDGTSAQPDELSISAIAQRESLANLTGLAWATTATVDTILTATTIHPLAMTRAVAAHQYEITPLAFAAAPFKYWTGSIVIRIRVVASPLMRGRLLVWHYPHNDTSYTSLLCADVTNTMNHCILDLESDTDVEFVVPMAQRNMWQTVGDIDTNTYGAEQGNGFMVVSVMNALTSPAPATAYLVATVRGGSDFRVAVPQLDQVASKWKYTASAPALFSSSVMGQDTGGPRPCVLGASMPSDAGEQTYFGEVCESFRALAKRYSAYAAMTPYLTTTGLTAGNPASAMATWSQYPVPPVYPVVAADPPHTWTWQSYAASAFYVMRGGSRWKVAPWADGSLPYAPNGALAVTRRANSGLRFSAWFDTTGGATAWFLMLASTMNGAAVASARSDVVEVEAPYYSPYAFVTPGDTTQGATQSGFREEMIALQDVRITNTTTINSSWQIIGAAADDWLAREWVGIGIVNTSTATALVPSTVATALY